MSKLLTTTRAAAKRVKPMEKWNIHPGEILREEFLKPLGLSAYSLAKRLHVPAPRVNDIVLEKRGVSADTAIRLARFFGTSEQFWMNLQLGYELRRAQVEARKDVASIKPLKRGGIA